MTYKKSISWPTTRSKNKFFRRRWRRYSYISRTRVNDLRLLEQLANHGLRATAKTCRWRSCVMCLSGTLLHQVVRNGGVDFPRRLDSRMSSKHSTDWKYHLQPWLKFGMKKKTKTQSRSGSFTFWCFTCSFRMVELLMQFLQLRFLLGRAPGLRVSHLSEETPSKNSHRQQLAAPATCNVRNVQRASSKAPCSILMSWRMLRFDFRIFHERHSKDSSKLVLWPWNHMESDGMTT